jgi:transcriptional regulator with XRE-family HTH domain
MSMSKKNDPKFEMAFDRGMLRSAFLSIFWAVISERKKAEGFTFQTFAKKIGSTKHEVSRWFNGDPNWTINTIASIANALNLDLRITAVDRTTGQVYTPSGMEVSPSPITINWIDDSEPTITPNSTARVQSIRFQPSSLGTPNAAIPREIAV